MAEKMFGLPDLPLKADKATTDADSILGLDTHAQALARFIAGCRTPMTIGIQGDWGTGKTSLMRLVEKHLSSSKTYGIWFNTWQYSQFSQEGRLAFSMLMNLTRKLRNVKVDRWPSGSAAGAFIRFGKGLLKASALVAGTAIGSRIAGADFDGEKLLDAFQSDEEKLDEAMLFEKLRDDFAQIVEEFVKATKCDKVIFYVDDLDRLQPARAIELLEVMKNFLDVEHAIFVLAIDYDVVVRGLQQRKGYDGASQSTEDSKSFFDKIIQVPYRMPTANYKADAFLCKHFGDLHGKTSPFVEKNARRLLDASIGNNPRAIKRLLNLHSLLRHLVQINRANDTGGRLAEAQLDQLLVLTCIQMAYFRMYSLIAKHSGTVGPEYVVVALMLIEDIHREVDEAVTSEAPNLNAEDAFASIVAKASEGPYKDVIRVNEKAFADAVRLVADELVLNRGGHLQGTLTDRHRRNVRVLAELFFDAIDSDGNRKLDEKERTRLQHVLELAQSTTVAQEADLEAPAGPRPVRVNFHDLCKPDASGAVLMRPQDALIFRDPQNRDAGVFAKPPVAVPDYRHEGAFMKVIFEGQHKTLSRVTRDLFQLIEHKTGTQFGAAENAGTVPMARYWRVQREGHEGAVLADLMDQFRARMPSAT